MKNIKTAILLTLLATCLSTFTSIGKATAEEIPEAECLTAYDGANDETACGYNCEKSGNGNTVACADWPDGTCKAGYSSVACGPPAPSDWQEQYQSRNDYDQNRDQDCDCDCDK